MGKKIGYTVLIWVFVIFAYVILAATIPAFNGIVETAAVNMQATSNMSNYPGTLEAVQAAPVYIWFIPGGVGIIASAVILKTSLVV